MSFFESKEFFVICQWKIAVITAPNTSYVLYIFSFEEFSENIDVGKTPIKFSLNAFTEFAEFSEKYNIF